LGADLGLLSPSSAMSGQARALVWASADGPCTEDGTWACGAASGSAEAGGAVTRRAEWGRVHTGTGGSRCRTSDRRGTSGPRRPCPAVTLVPFRPSHPVPWRRAGLSSWHSRERAHGRPRVGPEPPGTPSPSSAPASLPRRRRDTPPPRRLGRWSARPMRGRLALEGAGGRGRRSEEAERNERYAPPRLLPSGIAGLRLGRPGLRKLRTRAHGANPLHRVHARSGTEPTSRLDTAPRCLGVAGSRCGSGSPQSPAWRRPHSAPRVTAPPAPSFPGPRRRPVLPVPPDGATSRLTRLPSSG
jgi:hypothetical protein